MSGPTTQDHGSPLDEGPGASSAAVVIALLVGSAFVMILNETIMSIAIPALMNDLKVDTSTAQWLTSGFLLTMAVVIPTTGYMLQRFPPRAIFLAAMTLFSSGVLIAALAPGFTVLLVGRVVQATGTAVMLPLLMTTVMTLIPAERRGRTMGTISIVIAVAPAVGPTLSGLILSMLGWRWMFWIMLPIALLALVIGAVKLRVPAETRHAPLDIRSALISAVAFSGLIYGLSSMGAAIHGPAPMPPWIPVLVGAVALAVFVMRQVSLQREGKTPLLDLRPLTHRTYAVAVILVCLSMMALFGALILLPLYLQGVLHVSALVTGLLVLPGGLVMGLLGPPVGRLFDKIGARPLVIPGAVVLSVALWLFTLFGTETPLWLVIGVHIVLTVGLSLMFTPLMTEALGSLPPELYSHGSAIVATLQQVAGAAGTAIFITVMTLASLAPDGAIDAVGTHTAFLVAAIVSLVVVGLSFLVGRSGTTAAVTAS